MQRHTTLMAPAVLALMLAACQRPPLEGGAEGEGEVEEAPPMGRICGDDFFDKCETTKKITDKFRKIKKTNFQSVCSTTDDLLSQGVQFKFQVPRMLPDHDGSKDTIEVNMTTSNWSSDGADTTWI